MVAAACQEVADKKEIHIRHKHLGVAVTLTNGIHACLQGLRTVEG
jgi:sRNA-binding regulator protein Hfq